MAMPFAPSPVVHIMKESAALQLATTTTTTTTLLLLTPHVTFNPIDPVLIKITSHSKLS